MCSDGSLELLLWNGECRHNHQSYVNMKLFYESGFGVLTCFLLQSDFFQWLHASTTCSVIHLSLAEQVIVLKTAFTFLSFWTLSDNSW